MAEYIYEKYITNADNLKNTLEEYGVAIIPSVLDEQECENMFNGMWNTLECWTQNWDKPITKENKSSYKNLKYLFPKHSMLIQQYNIGHAPFIWNVRQNKKCVNIFSKFWNCRDQDLLVSFDAASFHLPPEITNSGWHRKTWYHVDQSYTRNNFECMQSWVTAFDVNDGDATLAFCEGSHKYHEEFAEYFGIIVKSDWYKLESQEEFDFYTERGCLEYKIKCPKGSMVFWDSRTLHCGVEAMRGRETENYRCVAYLCYTPRKLATKANIKKKIKAYEECRTTNHWPHKPKLFPKVPRTYGAELKEVCELPRPDINELGRRLIGYDV